LSPGTSLTWGSYPASHRFVRDVLTDLLISSATGCGGRGELAAVGHLGEGPAVTQRHYLQVVSPRGDPQIADSARWAEVSITAVSVRISSGSAYAALSGHDVHRGGGQGPAPLSQHANRRSMAEDFAPVPERTGTAVGTGRRRGPAAPCLRDGRAGGRRFLVNAGCGHPVMALVR